MRWFVLIACLSCACGKKAESEKAADKPATAASGDSRVASTKELIAKIEAAIKSGDFKQAADACGGMGDYKTLAAADAAVAARIMVLCLHDRELATAKADLAKLEAMRKDKPDVKPGIECDELHVDQEIKNTRDDAAYLKGTGIAVELDEPGLADLEKRFKVACP